MLCQEHFERLSTILSMLSADKANSDIPSWVRQQVLVQIRSAMTGLKDEAELRCLLLDCIRFIGDNGPASDDDAIIAHLLDLLDVLQGQARP